MRPVVVSPRGERGIRARHELGVEIESDTQFGEVIAKARDRVERRKRNEVGHRHLPGLPVDPIGEELDLGFELEIDELGVDRPVPGVGDGLIGAEAEACIVAGHDSEPFMKPLDSSLVRDPHAVVPDVVVGEDRPQHVGLRRREQRTRTVGDVEVLEPPSAYGIRAVDVEQLELDRHVVEVKPDLRHLRERADTAHGMPRMR